MPFVMLLHLTTALAALSLGTLQFALAKGTPLHRAVGRTWVAAMAVTAVSSFWLSSPSIPNWRGFGPIHLLSLVTLLALFRGLRAIRRGDIRRHRNSMAGAYAGLVIAGLFAALLPGRVLHGLLFG